MNKKNKIIATGAIFSVIAIAMMSGYIANAEHRFPNIVDDAGCQLVIFVIDENCTFSPYNGSNLGIKETRWLNDTVLLISANVSINCAFEIGNGDVKLEDGILKLEYEIVRHGDLMTNCNCGRRIVYIISNLDRGDYEIELVPTYIKL